MSTLNQFREAERELKLQLEKLEQMKNDTSLQKEIEFEEKLRSLMEEYDISLEGLVSILDPEAGYTKTASQAKQNKRRQRALKTYRNPHDGTVIETKGGNHKILKQWKSQYGSDEVETWLSKD